MGLSYLRFEIIKYSYHLGEYAAIEFYYIRFEKRNYSISGLSIRFLGLAIYR